ncbi:GNAT family N-acetyltransferase [Lacticaseibacillus daqingensis]|uniref:GNAT family N-acetyltransferase n=1 Tax=Lacticaseibacillus daqingensis TaxID=2486014 RepID=UPI000F7AF9D4|nr:GNAT family N-acetyltransferase [Lacticaseibacillus daqingensis]
MLQYTFESALTIHEIKALYGGAGLTGYLKDVAETARGIANSTLLTARDDGQLVGAIRGISDMHTVAFIQDLVVLPDYQHQGIGRELLAQFDDYFKQVARIVVVCDNAALRDFYAKAGFLAGQETQTTTFVRPRRLLEPRY